MSHDPVILNSNKIFILLLISGVAFHLLALASLVSEPFAFEHGVNLSGPKSHPQEKSDEKGFLDPFFHDTDRVPRGLDFFSIYQSGRNFLRGDSVYYGVRVHRLGEDALIVPYFSGFRYLPIYACTYGVMLNALPPWQSYWMWICLVELLLLFNLMIVTRLPLDFNHKILLIFMWLAYSPFYIELHIGQQSMVTVTLLHLAIYFHLKGKPTERDSCYIFSVIWKINTILFIPVWLKFKRFRTIAVLISLTILLSFPYFWLVAGSFSEFASYFKHKFIAVGPNSLGVWALFAGVLQRSGISHANIKLSLSLWTFFLLALTTLLTILPSRIELKRSLAMWICIYFITYQYVWEHHYVMMLPVFTILILEKNLRHIGVFVWLFCALPTPYYFINNPDLAMPQTQWHPLLDTLYHSTKVIPVLILYIVLALMQLKSPPPASPDSEPQLSLQSLIADLKGLLGIST